MLGLFQQPARPARRHVARALAVSGSAVLQAIPQGQAVAAARRGEVTALVRAVLGRGR